MILKMKLRGFLAQKESGKDIITFLAKVLDVGYSEIFDKKSKVLITERVFK